jgi:ABC-type cobalt transport system substrate-binding protein
MEHIKVGQPIQFHCPLFGKQEGTITSVEGDKILAKFTHPGMVQTMWEPERGELELTRSMFVQANPQVGEAMIIGKPITKVPVMKVFMFSSEGIMTKHVVNQMDQKEPLQKSFIRYFKHSVTGQSVYTGKILAENLEGANRELARLLTETEPNWAIENPRNGKVLAYVGSEEEAIKYIDEIDPMGMMDYSPRKIA